MAFNENKKRIEEELTNIGVPYETNEAEHKIIVDNKYWFVYTNNFYGILNTQEESKRGERNFLKMIKKEYSLISPFEPLE